MKALRLACLLLTDDRNGVTYMGIGGRSGAISVRSIFSYSQKTWGSDGFRCATPAEMRPALTPALRSLKAAVVEAMVDPDEPPPKPEEVPV
jgi:thiamine pyrophosphate-dependent acetolactate synthase large subunit-like protein